MDIKRGEIYYIRKTATTGAEMEAGRPAVVVSNNALNVTSMAVEVVYLTTREKNNMPEHVNIRSSGKNATALCEQIHTVSLERISSKLGTCTDDEMEQIENALLHSLGIDYVLDYGSDNDISETMPEPEPTVTTAKPVDAEVETLRIERDFYKMQYENLLSKLINK